jgi:hypothetical protein
MPIRRTFELMLAKHVVCTVPIENRAAFSAGQLGWYRLDSVPGFIAQFGGFTEDKAHILGLWATQEAYQRFMLEHHDRIAKQAGQSGTYSRIAVALYEVASPTCTFETLASALAVTQDLLVTYLLDSTQTAEHRHGDALVSLVGQRALPSTLTESAPRLEQVEFGLSTRRQPSLGAAQAQHASSQQATEFKVRLVPSWSVTPAF